MPRARSTTVVASPGAAAETVICTLPQIQVPPSGIIDLTAFVDVTIGTSGITALVKIERGTVAGGTIVATAGPVTVVAANRYSIPVVGQDSFAGEVAGQQYVLTLTIGSGAATSTVNNVYLGALFGQFPGTY